MGSNTILEGGMFGNDTLSEKVSAQKIVLI